MKKSIKIFGGMKYSYYLCTVFSTKHGAKILKRCEIGKFIDLKKNNV